jgi:Alginate lyase
MRRRTLTWLAAGAAVVVAVAAGTVACGRSGPSRHARRAPAATGSDASSPDGGGAGLGRGGPSGSPTGPAANRPGGFAHPGVLVGAAQLDFVRGRVQAGAQPWASAYAQLRGSAYASLSRTAKPRADVDCGSSSNPDNGCTDERTDALAAYADALVWYVSRDARYATKAIELLDAWSATLTTHTNSNAPLQTGWAGAGWARAAELVRSTYPGGWPNADRFGSMLRKVYLPVLSNGSGANGNWELIMTDALMGIAVFLGDRTAFNRAVSLWRGRVPAYVYLRSDGPAPLSPPGRTRNGTSLTSYWYGQTTLVDGLAQETCRDFGHAAMGLNAAFHAAETARLQGVDLWGEQKNRLAAALEFHAQYELGAPVPSWLCGGTVNLGTGGYWEPAYDALHTRLGLALPNTDKLLAARRPTGTDNHSSGWETLTSYGVTG